MVYSSPLNSSRVGLGLTYINDNLGDEKTNYIYDNVSYTIPLNRTIIMAFGLNAGVTNYRLDTPDIEDSFFADGFLQWNPNVGAGIYVSSKMWYVGVSSPRLLHTDLNKGEFAVIERKSYYAIGGKVFDIGLRSKFKATAITKITNGAPANYDVTGSFLFFVKLWLGASYRFNDADSMGFLADYQITNSIRLGYAYDVPTYDIRPYSGGTHEVILIYELPIRIGRIKSPSYF